MTFSIDQLDDTHDTVEENEQNLAAYIDALCEQFSASPEGQALVTDDEELGGWVMPFIEMGYTYIGVTPTQMDADDVDEIVNGLFPSKISIDDPSEADTVISELVAFWEFLKREYQLANADAILEFLHQTAPEFSAQMNDPANFGPAKSFVMAGKAAGFDMSTPEGLRAFQEAYNASLPPPGALGAGGLDDDIGFFPGELPSAPPSISAAEKAKKKRLRKQAKASRKSNRKKQKK